MLLILHRKDLIAQEQNIPIEQVTGKVRHSREAVRSSDVVIVMDSEREFKIVKHRYYIESKLRTWEKNKMVSEVLSDYLDSTVNPRDLPLFQSGKILSSWSTDSDGNKTS